ncbi:MAG: Wzy polymerase domain-containing protein [Ramlibacter sp.]
MTAWFCAFLFAAAWLLPLHILPWVSWHNELMATAAVVVAGLGGLRARWRHLGGGVVLPSVVVLPLLLAAAAALQWAGGQLPFAGTLLAVVSYALLCAAAAAVGYASAGRAGEVVPALRLLAQLLVALGLLQLAVVATQTFTFDMGAGWVARTIYDTRGGGNVAQPNQAALLFVMALAATAYLRQLRQLSGPATAILLVLLLAGLAATKSRSGLLALGVLLAWLLWQRRALPLPPRLAHVAAFAGVAALLFTAWPLAMQAYWGGTEEVNLTTSGRGAMWLQFLDAVRLRPWTGWGVLQVAHAQNAIAHQHAEVMAATYAHSVVLDVLLWVGIPGLVVLLVLAARWLLPRLRGPLDRDAIFCGALVLPVAVQALTEFPYAYSYILAPTFFALGVIEARHGKGALLRLPRAAAAGVMLAWAAGSAWSAWEYLRIEEDFRVARFETLRMGETPAAYEVPDVHLLTQLGALLRATRLQSRPGMAPEDLALLRDVAMQYPWGATIFRYATALALNGQMEEAARQLQVLRAMQGPKMHERMMRALDEMAGEHPVLRQLRQP